MNLLHLPTAVILSLLISLFVPLLSSLLARAHWGGEVVGLLTLALSTLNGFLTEWYQAAQNNISFDWKTAAGLALYAYVVAVVGRKALWAGTATDAKALALGSGMSHTDPFTSGSSVPKT